MLQLRRCAGAGSLKGDRTRPHSQRSPLVPFGTRSRFGTLKKLLKERGLEADHTTNKGRHCIPEHHECKAKFILHLQQVLNLNPQQISGVLLVEGPPFSLNDYDVDRILAEVRTSKPDAKVACVHEGAD